MQYSTMAFTVKTTPEREIVFSFVNLEGRKCKAFETPDMKDLLLKWSMQGNLFVQYYSYDQIFQIYQKNKFVLDFLQDPAVGSTIKVVSDNGTVVPIGIEAARVEVTEIPCTVTSMTFFDRLTDQEIVRESGHIVKCFDEFYEDFTISDELRKMLLLEDSDNYEMYSDTERDEFLFRLFKHVCLGGAVCQYEDYIEPYLTTAKGIYKDLVSVRKDPNTQELKVSSIILKVKAWDKDGFQFYPSARDHDQTFAYLIVDPLKRHIAVLYHKWGCGVF